MTEPIDMSLTEVPGPAQHVSSDRMVRAGEQFDQALAYAEKAEEHLWTVLVAHRITADHARRVAAGQEPALLDGESAAAIGLGCYRCEEPFTPRLADRRCRGLR